MTAHDIDEALDWLGRRVECKSCRFTDRLAAARAPQSLRPRTLRQALDALGVTVVDAGFEGLAPAFGQAGR